jgi:DNA polymerase (family 10)
MRAMAEAARARGYEYIAITDHSESLPIANGLSVERLRDNIAEARRLSDEMSPFRVLIGSEVEIKEDGSLDYTKDVLDELDMVVGAVHSRFKMTEREMTERIITALSNENLTILAHPTGRLIGQREPYLLDMEMVMDSAKSNGVSLEVNGLPDRLDLNDLNCRKAYEKGLMVSISTDSHSVKDLDNMRFGVATARRGWIGKGNVLNTKSLDDLERTLGI